MSYDEIISYLGEFGKYQRFIFFLMCLNSLVCAIHAFSIVFLLAQPNFRCALSTDNIMDTNTTNYELPAEIWESSYAKERPCEFYIEANASSTCSSYIYDKSVYPNSAVTEWHLVCDRSWLIALQQSLFMMGLLLGSIIFGQLSDKFGRKPILLLTLGIQVISGVIAGLAHSFISFTIARMFVGATITGVFIISYVLVMEMLGPRHRLFASVSLMVCYSLGALTAAAYAFFIRDWRLLQIAMALTGLLFLPYPWLVPESTRWLLTTNRKELALANIKKTVHFNKLNISSETIETLLTDLDKSKCDIVTKKQASTSTPTVLDLLKYPNMRRKSLLIFFDWFVITGTYYGLSWNTNLLGDNVLLNFVISAAIEIPAHCAMLLVLNRWGRRLVLCGSLLLAGLGLLLTMTPPNNMNWLIISFAMLGKFGITAAFGTIYIFSAEQFPTVVRNVGLGAASMMARIGGILVPFLYIGSKLWRPLPLIICGTLAFLGGSLTLLLPETLDKPTLETLADGENFTRKTKNVQLKRDLQNIDVN